MRPSKEQIALLPNFKPVKGLGSREIPVFRNGQNLSSDNVDGSTLQFFPTTANGVEAVSNYNRKPFTGDRTYDVIGLGFGVSAPSLRDLAANSNLDVPAFINDLHDAVVTYKTDERKAQLLDEHIQQLTATHRIGASVRGDAANQGFDKQVSLLGYPAIRTHEPLRIGRDEEFTLEVQFNDAGSFPSESTWDTIGQGGVPQLVSFLQVAYVE